jgi:hypothetical protein
MKLVSRSLAGDRYRSGRTHTRAVLENRTEQETETETETEIKIETQYRNMIPNKCTLQNDELEESRDGCS